MATNFTIKKRQPDILPPQERKINYLLISLQNKIKL